MYRAVNNSAVMSDQNAMPSNILEFWIRFVVNNSVKYTKNSFWKLGYVVFIEGWQFSV